MAFGSSLHLIDSSVLAATALGLDVAEALCGADECGAATGEEESPVDFR